MPKLDILALGAHPDDVELGCSGTIALELSLGRKVGIVDFTLGELGTRGDAETRKAESKASTEILGIQHRENLELADGFFQNNGESQRKLIQMIRKYQPEIVLANTIEDRHIDHPRASQLANDACFLSGLIKIETFDEQGNPQKAWRPKAVYHYIQDRPLKPDLVVDITKFWDVKLNSIKAFKTQFFNPESKEPVTPISTEDFLYFLEARAREMGRLIGVKFGEGFIRHTPIGVSDLFQVF